MKFGELLDLHNGYGLYDFGNQKCIKLFDENIDEDTINSEFKKTQLISEVCDFAIHVTQLIKVENRYGIVFEKVTGESLLYKLEQEPHKLVELSQIFAHVHSELHKCHIEDLIDQKTYFKQAIDSCEKISASEKTALNKSLRLLPTDTVVCHGNFHLNNIVENDTIIIMNFGQAYQGHPMSDIAKIQIILEVPRKLEGASDILQEEINNRKQQLLIHYLEMYKSISAFDENIVNQFLKFAAVVRLNENQAHEEKWLLNIIRS